jgi:hypothetical protein
VRKTHINNEHLHSKARELKLIWKKGVPDLLFPRSYWQVHSLSSHLLDCLVRDLNYEPWPVTVETNTYVIKSKEKGIMERPRLRWCHDAEKDVQEMKMKIHS